MQYGNEISSWADIRRDIEFKSYYVVWKRKKEDDVDVQKIMFKSYYVVWKHTTTAEIDSPKNCLNRTMQYGNAPTAMERTIQIAFKSYYVVWKLCSRGFLYARRELFKSYYVVWKRQYLCASCV